MPVTLNVVETETDLGIIVSQVVIESASEPGPSGAGVPAGGTTGQVLAKASDDDYDDEWVDQTGGGGGGVTDADYLVGTAHAGLSAEIVVGATPGGELGGTWASPTVDASHSGSTHAAVQAAAEATAAAALSSHEADTTSVHGITNTANLETTSGAQAKADAKVTQTITNGVTTTAPSEDAVFDALALKAALASPTFTGTVTLPSDQALPGNPTTTTQSAGNSTTRIATTAFVATAADAKVDDTAYDATTWNGDTTHAPSKNAVRDKIESLGGGSVSDTAYGAGWNGDTTVAPSKNAVYDEIELRATVAKLPKPYYALGGGSGDHTTASTSFADVAAGYSLTVPAVAGDVLEIKMVCTVSHSTTAFIVLSANVSGTGDVPHTMLQSVSTNSFNMTFNYFHVVQSGDISGGNVTVKPRWKTNTGTATMFNESASLQRRPTFSSVNWKQ